jgi:chemotaxis protein MotB
MSDQRIGPAPKTREVDQEEGGHDTSWTPPAPRPRARTSWSAVLLSVVALGAAGASGYWAWTSRAKLAMASANTHAAEHDLALEQKKATELGERVTGLEKQLAEHQAGRATAEKQVEAIQADASSTKAELEALQKQRAEVEQRLAAWKSITEKLRKMIDAGKLQVSIRDGRMILKLGAEILFDTGKADLAPDGKTALREVAGILRQFPSRRFMIAGHTDNIPLHNATYRDNWELSTARAVSVTEFLVASGVRPDRLVAAGYGEYDAVANNRTEAGRRENRRIELVLLPNIGELPPLPTEPAAPPTANAKAP